MTDVRALLAMLPQAGWVVGGAVRDRLLGRPTSDYDIAVDGDPRATARALARSGQAHSFQLSEGFGAWRVVARDRSWQVDVLALAGETIEQDLARRDLTINAIAEPLSGGPLVDPYAGEADLRAGRLRMVTPEAFRRDPLRTMRLARLACELGLRPDEPTRAAAARSAPALAAVAPERVFAELKRIVCAARALAGLSLMEELGATAAVLPELAALHGVEQSRYHHLDVHDHTLAVLAAAIELEADPGAWLGAVGVKAAAVLAEPLADELNRWQALRFGALLHDIAKPQTRGVGADGRVTFMGHDAAGVRVAREVFGRLRASERLAEHVAALAADHLRLGFLVHRVPLTRREIYRYLHACEPVEVDVTVLSVADRMATKGANSEAAIAAHLSLARELLAQALAWRAARPRPPLRGDELAEALDLQPGPELGVLLQELEEASFAGEIGSRREAIERARATLDRLRA